MSSYNSRSHPNSRQKDDTLSLNRILPPTKPHEYEGNSPSEEIAPSLGLHLLQTQSSRLHVTPRQIQPSIERFAPSTVSRVHKKEGEGASILSMEYSNEKMDAFAKKETSHSSKTGVKSFVVILLLLLQGFFVYSVYIHKVSENKAEANGMAIVVDQLKHGWAVCVNLWTFIATSIVPKQPLPLMQLQKRLQLGQSLLNELNDPLGAHVACASVTNVVIHHYGENTSAIRQEQLSSSILSVIAFLNEDENRLLAHSLLCMGDAKLALVSPSSASAISWSGVETKYVELVHANDVLEAAVSVDPTNTAIRASLGLSFLLLGTMPVMDTNNAKYIVHSIEHFNVAVSKSNPDDPINLAARHNLGLAYVALDSLRTTEGSQFLNSLSSMQNSQHTHLDSLVPFINKGATLLQMGETKDAITSLGSMTQLLSCNDEEIIESDTTLRSRRSEACALIQQNLALADGFDHWNQLVSSYPPDTVEGSTSSLVDDATGASGSPTILNDTNDSFVDDTTEASDSPSTVDETVHFENVDGSNLESLEENGTMVKSNHQDDDHIDSNDRKTAIDLQNALYALENAANEGTPRPRLLLALAKARSSTGDLTGAIDAMLIAINHATSTEETEILTTYLETIMSKLVGETQKEASEYDTKQITQANRGRTVSELELSLEIEKLKYRVLEQEHALKYREIRLGSDQPQLDYTPIDRSIDYSQDKMSSQTIFSNQVHNTLRHDEEPFDQIEDQRLSSIKKIVSDDSSLMDLTSPDSEVVDESDVDVPKNSSAEMIVEDENVAPLNLSQDEGTESNTIVNGEAIITEENITTPEPITLPSLFDPEHKPPLPLSASAKSYMKIADAYLDKGKYDLASKQFLKVIRKAPDHLAAYLGYATALERAGRNKQLNDAALAYGNATKVAVSQSDKVDPMIKSGGGGMAESILRRAIQIAQSASTGRLELLRSLSKNAHTAALAADVYHAIGMELSKQDATQTEATKLFAIANEFIRMRNDSTAPCHIPSTIEIGKVALEQGDTAKAIEFFEKLKDMHLADEDHVKLLVLSGKAHLTAGEIDTAVADLTRALSFPQCTSTALAHHELAIALSKSNGEAHEINLHFEKALDLGMDPTEEAIAALGEHNMSIMRSFNRHHWRQMNEGHQAVSTGGIMSGGGVGSQKSVFAPQAEKEEESSSQQQTLSLLEQGAASYDGHVPMGGEIDGESESSLSNLSGRKRT